MSIIRPALLIPALSLVLFMTGCANNSLITVYNDTDKSVWVYYTYLEEEECTDSSGEEDTCTSDSYENAHIGAHDYKEIEIEGNSLSDGEITSVFGGIVLKTAIDIKAVRSTDVHLTENQYYNKIK